MTPARTKQMIGENSEINIDGSKSTFFTNSNFIEPNVFGRILQVSSGDAFYNSALVLAGPRYYIQSDGTIYDATYGILDFSEVIRSIGTTRTYGYVKSSTSNEIFYAADSSNNVKEYRIVTDIKNRAITVTALRLIYTVTTKTFRLFSTKDYLVHCDANVLTAIDLKTLSHPSYTITNLSGACAANVTSIAFPIGNNELMFYGFWVDYQGAGAYLYYNRMQVNIATGAVVNQALSQNLRLKTYSSSLESKTLKTLCVMRKHIDQSAVAVVQVTPYWSNTYQKTNLFFINITAGTVTLSSLSLTANAGFNTDISNLFYYDESKNSFLYYDQHSQFSTSPTLTIFNMSNTSTQRIVLPYLNGLKTVPVSYVYGYGVIVQNTTESSNRNYSIALISYSGEIHLLNPAYSYIFFMTSMAYTPTVPSSTYYVSGGHYVTPYVKLHGSIYRSSSETFFVPIQLMIDVSKPLVKTPMIVQK